MFRKLSCALFLFLLTVYLATYTPRINSSDGLAMYATAESLVRWGRFDVEQIYWLGLQQGSFGLNDDLLYSRKGVGVPLALLPLVWLGLTVPLIGPVMSSLMFNPLITALTAVLLMAYLHRLGFHERTSMVVALTFGLSTLAWPYAKSLFSDPFSGLLLLTAAYCLLQFRLAFVEANSPPPPADNNNDEPEPPRAVSTMAQLGWPLLAGIALGWNIGARYAEAIFVPLFALYMLTALPRPHWKRLLGPLIALSMPIMLTLLALAAFNMARYGDPFNTGYLPNENFSGLLWQGLAGQLISPGRGLLLYCPILLLSFIGLLPFWQRFRAESLLALSLIVLHLLLYGKWFMWHGGYAWGPRFLIPTLPFWAMFLAPLAETFRQESTTPFYNILRFVYGLLFFGGLIPQLLSVTIDFAPFQDSLLETGLPLFAPETFFDWQYSPLVAAWAFVNPENLDLLWAWSGRLNRGLVLLIIFNMGITGAALLAAWRAEASWRMLLKPLISTPLLLIAILVTAHNLPITPLKQTVTRLNRQSQPHDTIILNDPELTAPFSELYKGRSRILGLNQGGGPLPDEIASRLNTAMAQREQLWWLPNWLPPMDSAIERRLLEQNFRVQTWTFGQQRLVLFVTPRPLPPHALPLRHTFRGLFTLQEIRFDPQLTPNAPFPLELQWQAEKAPPENYHVFIHLVTAPPDAASTDVPLPPQRAQTDGPPVNGLRPTTGWAVGETVVDRHALWVPPNLPPGNYLLRVGWYLPADGARLRLINSEDAIEYPVQLILPD